MTAARPPRTAVVVGMLCRPDGALLMTSRPLLKAYAGYWEFPGGKVESNELPEQALGRELREEIGVEVVAQQYAWTLSHDYPHAKVELQFYWITDWCGTEQPLEHQGLLWVRPADAWPYPVLPATVPLLARIREEAMRLRQEPLKNAGRV